MFTNRVNKKYTTPVWMDRAINHLHLRGNHYAIPVRNQLGQCVEMILVNPDEVEVFEDQGDVYYKIRGDEKLHRSENFIHVPHLGNGVVGKSTIGYAKDDLGLEMSRRDYGSDMYATGGRPPGLLKPSQYLTDPQRSEAEAAWTRAKKKGGDVVMPSGFDYQVLSFNPQEVEFLQAGNFSLGTVSRWFGVPRHKLYDPEGISYNSNEHAAIEFLSDTMAPILTKFEYEYSSKIFQLPREQKMYLEFDMNAYVRPDTTTRYEAYAKGIHAGVLQPKEARDRENLPFIEGTARNFINSGSIPIDLMDDFVKSKNKGISPNAAAKLKEKFNGQTQDILDILSE